MAPLILTVPSYIRREYVFQSQAAMLFTLFIGCKIEKILQETCRSARNVEAVSNAVLIPFREAVI